MASPQSPEMCATAQRLYLKLLNASGKFPRAWSGRVPEVELGDSKAGGRNHGSDDAGRGRSCDGAGAGTAAGGRTCTLVVVPSHPASNNAPQVTVAHFAIRCFIALSPCPRLTSIASRHPNRTRPDGYRKATFVIASSKATKRLRVPKSSVNGHKVLRVDQIKTFNPQAKVYETAHLGRFGTALYHHFPRDC